MSLLSKVTKGKVQKPHFMLVYGPDGVGKSSFSAQAPAPVFLGSEDGTNNLDVSRFRQLTKWGEVGQALKELIETNHDYKTLVIDTLDWLEPLLYKHVCEIGKVSNIEDFGYGKGYSIAFNYWLDLKSTLMTLREKMNVILLAHAEIVPFNDPSTNSTYDRFQLKLHKKASALFREAVDCVLFANYEIFTKKDGNKTRAFGDGARLLYTERRPGFDAKNRMGLHAFLPLGWSDYDAATRVSSRGHEKIKEQLVAMLEEIKNPEFKKLVSETIEKAGDNVAQLEAIENRLRIRLEE